MSELRFTHGPANPPIASYPDPTSLDAVAVSTAIKVMQRVTEKAATPEAALALVCLDYLGRMGEIDAYEAELKRIKK